MSGDESQQQGHRTRVLIALGTLAALAILVVVVLVASSGEERTFEPAPQACIDDWNDDGAAQILGQHQFDIHRYQRLEIAYMKPDGTLVEEGQGSCAVIFSAAVLDAEPSSTVQIKRAIGWVPLSGQGVPNEDLAKLQTGSQEAYNALLQPDGSIDAL